MVSKERLRLARSFSKYNPGFEPKGFNHRPLSQLRSTVRYAKMLHHQRKLL